MARIIHRSHDNDELLYAACRIADALESLVHYQHRDRGVEWEPERCSICRGSQDRLKQLSRLAT